VFKYYASGRTNLGFVLATLELAKRQDLLSAALITPFFGNLDKVTYEIPIKQETPSPAVLCLCRANQVKTVRQNFADVRHLTHIVEAQLPGNYCLLAESQEIADVVFNSSVLKLVAALGNSVESVYVTDQMNLLKEYTLSLVANFYHPKDADLIAIQAQLVISVADLASKICLSAKARDAAEKERQVLNKDRIKEEKQQREDERLQKKMEMKKKEEEKNSGLSKEKKRKMEEKEYRKELKKKGMKFKMIKG
jgi:hypothetical protein